MLLLQNPELADDSPNQLSLYTPRHLNARWLSQKGAHLAGDVKTVSLLSRWPGLWGALGGREVVVWEENGI